MTTTVATALAINILAEFSYVYQTVLMKSLTGFKVQQLRDKAIISDGELGQLQFVQSMDECLTL